MSRERLLSPGQGLALWVAVAIALFWVPVIAWFAS